MNGRDAQLRSGAWSGCRATHGLKVLAWFGRGSDVDVGMALGSSSDGWGRWGLRRWSSVIIEVGRSLS